VLSERLLKLAIPFCGVAVRIPASPLPVVRATMTGFEELITGFPLLSSTTTVIAGVMVAPVNALEGCREKASFAGTAAGALPLRLITAIPLVEELL
jgi:hypothetical protein